MQRAAGLTQIFVYPSIRTAGSTGPIVNGHLIAGTIHIPCLLGRTGIGVSKREGDGRSPRGNFRILAGYYRPDRIPRPFSRLILRPITPSDGWCDDPRHSQYNRLVKLPFPASHEKLRREDMLYDVVLILDYNLMPRTRNFGSAIFFHAGRDRNTPTEGCIAIERRSLIKLLARLGRNVRLKIG